MIDTYILNKYLKQDDNKKDLITVVLFRTLRDLDIYLEKEILTSKLIIQIDFTDEIDVSIDTMLSNNITSHEFINNVHLQLGGIYEKSISLRGDLVFMGEDIVNTTDTIAITSDDVRLEMLVDALYTKLYSLLINNSFIQDTITYFRVSILNTDKVIYMSIYEIFRTVKGINFNRSNTFILKD